VIASWVLAWTRFAWFAPWQRHTFLPLWLGFIVAVNALTQARTGTCLLGREPGRFLALFPVSLLFWWFFEYLNRFVQNWRYTADTYTPAEYFLLASVSFATVLPAVLSVRELVASSAIFDRAFAAALPLRLPCPRLWAGAALLVAGAGLFAIGRFPNLLFGLLWAAPLVIITAWRALAGEPGVCRGLARGDWRLVASAALAALACGWFWEMWNYGSLAQWHYQIPFVQRFHIFEMPLLGYAGYLPFGLECVAAAEFVGVLRLVPPPHPGGKP